MDSVIHERVARRERELEVLRHVRPRHAWRPRWAAIGAAIAVSLGAGAVIQRAGASTDVSAPSSFVSVVPFRVFDTRPAPNNVGGWVGPITGNSFHDFTISGVGTVPVTAVAVVMNVTVTGTTMPGYLTVWPTGTARPTASNLNWSAAGVTVPNLVTVLLSSGGQVSVYNLQGGVHVIGDIVGYYTKGNDKFLSLPVDGVSSSVTFTNGFGPFAGMKLPDSGSPWIAYNLVLPDDFTYGGTLSAKVSWHTQSTNCSVVLSPDYVSVGSYPNQFIEGFSPADGMSGGGVLANGPIANRVNMTTFTLATPDSSPLWAGYVYTFGFFRDATNPSDTCTSSMSIDAVTIRYT